jgi:hypothetical protein
VQARVCCRLAPRFRAALLARHPRARPQRPRLPARGHRCDEVIAACVSQALPAKDTMRPCLPFSSSSVA